MSETFDLKARLEELGLKPKKSFGQNFLVSKTVIQKIIAESLSKPHSDLIEIGPGLGALTEHLLNEKPRLIEFDSDFVEIWRGRGLDVVEADAVKLDWSTLNLRPDSLLVSNLPYQISTHLVVERCFGPVHLKHMVLMFQKEVAEKLTAKPRTKAYGLLSVLSQTYFHIRKVVDAAPRDFFPAPKVASRVLAFERKPSPKPDPRFLKVLKAGFAFRRKFLLKNLKGVVDKSTMAELPAIFKKLNLKPEVRAEELSPEQWLELFSHIHERN